MQLDQGEPKDQFKPSVSITTVTTLVMMLVTGAYPGFPVRASGAPPLDPPLSDAILILNNRVTRKWVAIPFSVFNENSITSIIIELLQR